MGHADGKDSASPGFEQRSGAFMQGAAGGDHIIHQQQPFTCNCSAIDHAEGSLQVMEPVVAVQFHLGGGPAGADQPLPQQRDLPDPGQDFAQQQRLVETAHPQPLFMQRHRQQDLRCRLCSKKSQLLCSQKAQGAAQVRSAVVFEGMDQVAACAFVGQRRPCRAVVRRIVKAAPAGVIVTRSAKRNAADATDRGGDER